MLWHNSFAGKGRARAGLCEPKACQRLLLVIFASIRLASAKIKRRINRNKALRVSGLWGVP
jgi:hypothetical protein